MSEPNSPNGNSGHTEAARSHARAAAEEVRDAAAEAAREFRDRVDGLAGEWKEKAREAHKNLESYVRENPTKSVLAALGVGFIVGLILRR